MKKKLIDIFALMAVIALAALTPGCGDDDDDDDDDDNGGGQPTSFAPANLTARTVTLTEGGQTRDITFASTGTTFNQFGTGTTNVIGSGTYQYSRIGNNNGQLVLTTTDDQGATRQVTYNMSFTSGTAGTYSFVASDGNTGTGTFSNLRQATTPPPDPGNGDGDGDGDGNGNGNGGTPGTIPTSLGGRVIDFTAAGLGNERLTFGSDGTVTSDAINPPNNVGTYTYSAGASGSPSTLVVTFPNGDRYDLTMNFSSANQGSWSGNQYFDNTDHPAPAGSSFTIQN